MDENFEKNTQKEEDDNFADVNYGREESKEPEASKKEKKRSKGFIAGIALALVAVIAVVFLAKTFIFSSKETGLSNMYNSSIGIVKGKKLYHASVDGTEFAKTDIKTGEKEVFKNSSVAFLAEYKGKVYYYDTAEKKYYRLNESGDDVLIHDGMTLYPQFSGNYVYYITPDSTYGGFVRRTPISGGDEEIVLNVNCSYFTVESGNIIYYDPAIDDLLIVKMSEAMKFAKEADGEANESADIKAVVLLEDTAASYVNVKGRYVYYSDADDSNKIKRLDMSKGDIIEIGHGIMGSYMNIYDDYIYYVSPSDNRIYRCNLDGSDIRDLTGTNYARTAGVSIYDGYMVYYALVGYYDDNMQTQYNPVIVVAKTDGTRMCEIPGNGGADIIDESENQGGEETDTGETPDETTPDGATDEAPATAEG